MGLDMHLSAKYHIGMELSEAIANALNLTVGEVSAVLISVAYWREANAIHQWFEQNVQNSNEGCGGYVFEGTKIIELHTLCDELIQTRQKSPTQALHLAKTKLPEQGFDSPYDKNYWDDVLFTKEQLDRVIAMYRNNPENCTFIYETS